MSVVIADVDGKSIPLGAIGVAISEGSHYNEMLNCSVMVECAVMN